MAQPIILDLQSRFEDRGIKEAEKSLSSLTTSANRFSVAGKSLTQSYSQAITTVARPLATANIAVLSTKALEASESLGKMSEATRVANSAASSLASALVFAGGPLGLAIATFASLAAVVVSIANALKDTRREIVEGSKALLDNARNTQNALNALKTLGLVSKEQAKTIEGLVQKDREELKAKLETAKAALEAATARRKELEEIVKEREGTAAGAAARFDLVKAIEEEKKARETLIALGPTAIELVNEQIAKEKELQAAIETRTQAEIELGKKARDEAIAAARAKAKALAELEAKNIEKVRFASNLIASFFQAQDKKIVFSAKQAEAEILKAVGESLAKQLEMKAVAALATGNVFKAAALTAAAGVIRGIAGAAASAILGGGAGAVGGGEAAGGFPSAAPAAPVTEEARPTTQLIVNVQGDFVGETSFVDKLAKRISERVQEGDVQLIASNVVPAAGTGF